MLTTYYDLSRSPPTYDVVGFLLAIERYRVQRGEDKLSICVLPGPAGGFRQDSLWPRSVEERQRMLHNVALPMMRLLPSAAEVTVLKQRPQRAEPWSLGFNQSLYGTQLLVACIGEGHRPLRALKDSRDERLVTMTLREAAHWPQRNSDVPQWVAAAKKIEARGYRVVVVRDTLKGDEPLDGVTTSRSAAWDLYERANLYRSAACNLFVNNGPAWFAMALDCPVVIIKPTVEGVTRTCSAGFFKSCGVPVGQSIPKAPDYQRIIWTDDTEAAIMASFDAFMENEEVVYA